MIPIILGVILLCGIVFTVVYKKTSGTNPNNIQEEQTLAPKETQTIETRISIDEIDKDLDDFSVNETKGREAGDGVDIEYLDAYINEKATEDTSIETSINEETTNDESQVEENSSESLEVGALVVQERLDEINDELKKIEESQRAEAEQIYTPDVIDKLYEMSGY